MNNLLVRAAQVAAIAFPLLTLPTLGAAAPIGSFAPAAGLQSAALTTRSSENTRQPLMQARRQNSAAGKGSKSSWIDPRYAASIVTGATPLVYVSLTGANEVLAYPANPLSSTPVETITGLVLPTGLAVDATGSLYVVEFNDVKVFAPGVLSSSKTLLPPPGPVEFLSIAVDGRGTVYVGTVNVATCTGSVAVYTKGATTPTTILSDPAILSANGIAVDGAGNIFLNYSAMVSTNFLGNAIGALPASTSIGETFFHRLNIDNAPNSPQPLGVTLDKNGDLVIADTTGVVSIYPPAKNTPAMSFQATAPIGNTSNVNLALTGPNNHHLLVAPYATSTIYEYAYPSGTLQGGITLPSRAIVGGLATSPAPAQGIW